MTVNLGSADRIIRLVLGLVLLFAPFVSGMTLFSSGTATVISIVVGIVLIGTAALRFCPLYRIFGIRTCRL